MIEFLLCVAVAVVAACGDAMSPTCSRLQRVTALAVVTGAALLATSSAFTFGALPSRGALVSSSRSGSRTRTYSASPGPSMVASMPRVADNSEAATTGTSGAPNKRLHVQVREEVMDEGRGGGGW